jgi:hypothetical protein
LWTRRGRILGRAARAWRGGWSRGYGWDGRYSRGGSIRGGGIQDGVGRIDSIHHFSNITHRSQVTFVEQDADRGTVAGENLNLVISIERVCRASRDAPIKLYLAINGKPVPKQ